MSPEGISVLNPPGSDFAFPKILAPDSKTPGRLLALANWLASERIPADGASDVESHLAASFGKGLVRYANDFGHMGRASCRQTRVAGWLASRIRAPGSERSRRSPADLNSAALYQQSSLLSQSR